MKVSQLLTRYLVNLAERTGFVWERNTARYRDKSTGRFVSENTLTQLQSDFTEYARGNLDKLTDRLIGNQVDVATWQKVFAQE